MDSNRGRHGTGTVSRKILSSRDSPGILRPANLSPGPESRIFWFCAPVPAQIFQISAPVPVPDFKMSLGPGPRSPGPGLRDARNPVPDADPGL